MEYGRLGRPETQPVSASTPHSRKPLLLLLSLLSLLLILLSSLSVAFLIHSHHSSSTPQTHKPTSAISNACGLTKYPTLCINSLLSFPGASSASERDLVHLSINMTLQRLSRSLSVVDPNQKAAGTAEDVLTWLSAALTNHDTCAEELEMVGGGSVKEEMQGRTKDLAEMVSNCLAIFSVSSKNKEFAGIPIQNRRRRLMAEEGGGDSGYPGWVGRKERRLLQMPVTTIHADFVVSKDGNGTFKTIEEAVKATPDWSFRRIIVYIKAGRYEENIKLNRKKTNLMFIGDGKGLTIVSGSRSVYDNFTTFHTATFAATGLGFIARDITFENSAGPWKHQAVALRVGADHAVVYRCNIIGYQDTLYVHSQRQFFRECDIYGTVDFIFGNAAVVIQNCTLFARKPLPQQKNTITAQNRKDVNQNTGISIHASRIFATQDLEQASETRFDEFKKGVMFRFGEDTFREAKENGFNVTVIRKGQLQLNVGQTLEEVEEEITEIGSKMYHDKFMSERSIDMGTLMKGVFGSPSRKSTKRI
ncbi:putative pectinesterase/pectinesterase inhibitor 34 [Acorus calamus]|uniref:Pectinesterase n=1 Tax=Acorus calamus TaxID=4465 RepID=A0AAV9F9D2_ACOCL|nr:putative pectinesterase/pectinesterase inhibitor 34 [Acorus calamus]